MIIEIEKEYTSTVDGIKKLIEDSDCRPDILFGDLYTVIAVEGDATKLDPENIENFQGVVRVWRITSPYKSIARQVIGKNQEKVERERLAVRVPGPDGLVRKFSDESFTIIVGPCTVESYDQLYEISARVSELADKYNLRDKLLLRGGAYKPRTRPQDFRGLGLKAIDYLDKVREKVGLPYVTEVMAVDQIGPLASRADVLQIGTRNYQNFNLLEAVGATGKPILYKRGMAAPLEEWLSACEYIALQGNKKIILCERGVKSTTHGDYNRSHIDFDVIRAIKKRTILPVVIDPSHSSGLADLVPFQFAGSLSYGASGAMVEVIADGTDRKSIKCDGKQGLRLKNFEKLIQYLIQTQEAQKSLESLGED